MGLQPPIADYALLGDCQSAALVDRTGSLDWWCAPRFDSRSTFARILDESAGHWSIRPEEPFEVEREYLPDTMVLRTTFRTEAGTLRLTDALALAPGARGHDIGHESPHAVLRHAEALDGTVPVVVEYVPRPEYGLVRPVLVPTDAGLESLGGPDTTLLVGDHALEPAGDRATARIELRQGQSAAWALHHRQGLDGGGAVATLDPRAALDDTVEAWRSWTAMHTAYEGAYAEQVRRSALVLQALTYQPSGAVVAAATTSLPEIPGGEWNWDYRFSWLRDASLTLKALWVGACPDEAARYFDWMARSAGSFRADGHVQIMFGVEGERDLTEHELVHLDGYHGARPVRVGNAAWDQTQLDVYGQVLEAAWALRDQLGRLDAHTAAFLRSLADRAAESWREEDDGIWEGREGKRHYTSSKVMCWTALDRAVKLADRLDAADRVEAWTRERDSVREAILEQGWHEEAGAYTGAFGSHHLDASVLLMPLVDFLPADDERMRQTIDVIERELGDGGLVSRWTGGDDEGAFVICSCWLAESLARGGDARRAREVLDGVWGYANDVGLLAEEVDRRDGAQLGNFPQAFSHVGFINAAWAIEQAEHGQPQATGEALPGAAA